ncbi:MAG: acyl-CoA thioesterase [Nannocystaceae bacterium]
MSAFHDHHHRVLPEEIDGLGHVNNLCYVAWLQDAAIAHSSARGWPPERYHQLGAFWVVRRHTIEYRRAALLGDEVVVRTWIAAIGRIDCTRKYEIRRVADGALLADAETRWVFVDRAFTPRRIDPAVAAAFEVEPAPSSAT